MKKNITLVLLIIPIMLGLFWHPFLPLQKNYIYKLENYKKNNLHKQYLLLKNNTSTPIYNDMNIKGPFESVIIAHQSIQDHLSNVNYGELHYLPIVRKNYAN